MPKFAKKDAIRAEKLFYNVHLGNFVPGGPANAWRTKRAAMRFAESLVKP